jgi:hypothetical protein
MLSGLIWCRWRPAGRRTRWKKWKTNPPFRVNHGCVVPVGALVSIACTPADGAVFDFNEMKRIREFASATRSART